MGILLMVVLFVVSALAFLVYDECSIINSANHDSTCCHSSFFIP